MFTQRTFRLKRDFLARTVVVGALGWPLFYGLLVWAVRDVFLGAARASDFLMLIAGVASWLVLRPWLGMAGSLLLWHRRGLVVEERRVVFLHQAIRTIPIDDNFSAQPVRKKTAIGMLTFVQLKWGSGGNQNWELAANAFEAEPTEICDWIEDQSKRLRGLAAVRT